MKNHRITMSDPRQTAWSRRKFVLSGSAIVGAAAAACGPAGGSSGGNQASSAKITGTTEFWQWGTGYNDGFQKLTDEFNEAKTGVTVNFVPSTGGYWDKLTAALAGNDGPDVFLMNTNARAWWAQGQLRDLTDLVKRDKDASKDHSATLKAFDEWYRPEGKISGLPWDYSTISTHFSLANLNQVGLKPPTQLGKQWNWNTLLEYAQKLTRRGAGPQDTRYGFVVRNSDESGWLNFVFANGGGYLSEDLKRCTIAEPPAMEAIDFLAQMVQKHKVAPTLDEIKATGRNDREMFQQGLASMWTAGDWEFARHLKVDGFAWDATIIPYSPKTGKTGNAANLRGLVMSSQSQQVEPTWAFMKFMLGKPVQDRVVELFQEVPARTESAIANYTNPKAGPPAGRKLLEESIKATRALPAHHNVPLSEFRNYVRDKVRDVLYGKIGVTDGLRDAQGHANAVFEQYNKKS